MAFWKAGFSVVTGICFLILSSLFTRCDSGPQPTEPVKRVENPSSSETTSDETPPEEEADNRDTILEPYQIPWLAYKEPDDYSKLRFDPDTLIRHFKYRNYKKVFSIPDYYSQGNYYMLSPAVNDAVFQESGMSMWVDPQMILDKAYLFSYEESSYLENGLFAVSVLKETGVYLSTLYYLIYSPEGELIDKFVLAEYSGDGGYTHSVKGKFENDSTYVSWGDGYDVSLQSEKGEGSFTIDTTRYVISRNGKVLEI